MTMTTKFAIAIRSRRDRPLHYLLLAWVGQLNQHVGLSLKDGIYRLMALRRSR